MFVCVHKALQQKCSGSALVETGGQILKPAGQRAALGVELVALERDDLGDAAGQMGGEATTVGGDVAHFAQKHLCLGKRFGNVGADVGVFLQHLECSFSSVLIDVVYRIR
jgi:hypothetical protein